MKVNIDKELLLILESYEHGIPPTDTIKAIKDLFEREDIEPLEIQNDLIHKRRTIAIAAMTGILANENIIGDYSIDTKIWIAEHSVQQADALIKELDKEESK